jgi:hypothetical protein
VRRSGILTNQKFGAIFQAAKVFDFIDEHPQRDFFQPQPL